MSSSVFDSLFPKKRSNIQYLFVEAGRIGLRKTEIEPLTLLTPPGRSRGPQAGSLTDEAASEHPPRRAALVPGDAVRPRMCLALAGGAQAEASTEKGRRAPRPAGRHAGPHDRRARQACSAGRRQFPVLSSVSCTRRLVPSGWTRRPRAILPGRLRSAAMWLVASLPPNARESGEGSWTRWRNVSRHSGFSHQALHLVFLLVRYSEEAKRLCFQPQRSKGFGGCKSHLSRRTKLHTGSLSRKRFCLFVLLEKKERFSVLK